MDIQTRLSQIKLARQEWQWALDEINSTGIMDDHSEMYRQWDEDDLRAAEEDCKRAEEDRRREIEDLQRFEEDKRRSEEDKQRNEENKRRCEESHRRVDEWNRRLYEYEIRTNSYYLILYKTVVTMKKRGLSFDEIAEQIGITTDEVLHAPDLFWNSEQSFWDNFYKQEDVVDVHGDQEQRGLSEDAEGDESFNYANQALSRFCKDMIYVQEYNRWYAKRITI